MARRFFFGSSRNDNITGSSLTDLIFTGRGDDTINSGGGNDLVYAGSGNDWIWAGTGNDIVFAGSGNDTIFGESGHDLLAGGSGNDTIIGGSGADGLFGQSGNDTFQITLAEETSGLNYISGGSGIDTIVLNLTAEEFASQAVADDLNTLLNDIEARIGNNGQVNGPALTLESLSLRVEDVENIQVFVDGEEVSASDAGPVIIDEDPIVIEDEFDVTGGTVEGSIVSGGAAADAEVTLVSDVSGGDLALNSDGTFTFDAGDDFNDLAAGETQEVSFTVDVTVDGVVTTSTTTLTVTGENDAPVVGAALVAAADGDDVVTLDLLEGASDVDNDAVLSVTSVSDLPAGVTLDGTTLSVDPSDGAFASLAAGETEDITVTFNVTDENGATAAQTATITVTGSNDAPVVAAALVADVDGDDAVTIDLLEGASDVDTDAVLSVVNVSELPAGVSLDGTTLSVDPSNAAFDALAAGQTEELTVTFDVMDENGGAVAQTATFTVTGSNDVPVVEAALVAEADEGDATLTVDLLDGASDVDNGAVLSVANVSELPAGVTLDGNMLVVDPSDAAFNDLAAGETQDIVVNFEVVDSNGGVVAQTATITVTGTDEEAPIVEEELVAEAPDEDGNITLDLLSGATDANGETLTIVNLDTLPDGVTLDGTTLSVDPSDAAFDALAAGETQDVVITFDIVNESGAAVSQSATITVTGANDAPVVAAALVAEAADGDAEVTTLDLLDGASDVDNDAVLSVVNVSDLPAGVSLDGTTLSVDASDAAFASLAAGQTEDITVTFDVMDENGGAVSQSATITVTGANDAPVVAAALVAEATDGDAEVTTCLLYTSPSPRDGLLSRMPSSA